MRIGVGVLVAAAALVITACSPAAEAEAPSGKQPPTTASSAAAPAKAPTKRNRVGDKVTSDGVSVQLQAFRRRVRLDVTPDGPANHWAAAKIKTCYEKQIRTAKYMVVSWYPWSLVDVDAGRWTAFSDGTVPDNWLSPVYPVDDSQQVQLGECVVGWIEFPVDNGTAIKQVRYTVDGQPAITWTV